jgi:hypothetical protein
MRADMARAGNDGLLGLADATAARHAFRFELLVRRPLKQTCAYGRELPVVGMIRVDKTERQMGI